MKRIYLILLAFCFVMATEAKAQDRLYPPSYDEPESITGKYQDKVDKLLINAGNYTYFAFEIQPSFSAESGCYYDSNYSALILRTANSSIWDSKFGDNDSSFIKRLFRRKKVAVKEYRCPITEKTVKCFYNLFLAATKSSSYLAEPNGLDGTTYRIIAGSRVAECWSPDKDSNCGKLVEILYSLSDAIKQNNPQAIESLIPMVEELTERFKSLYPEDLEDIWEAFEG